MQAVSDLSGKGKATTTLSQLPPASRGVATRSIQLSDPSRTFDDHPTDLTNTTDAAAFSCEQQ